MIRRSILTLGLTSLIVTAKPGGGGALWYDKPAANWTEALPVGNGSLGGMIFGGTHKERIQFNEQTLWTGDEIQMGSYQPFGDIFIDSPDPAEATRYRRELDLSNAVHHTGFTSNGASFTREVFSSHPDKVMVIRSTSGPTTNSPATSSFSKPAPTPRSRNWSNPGRISSSKAPTANSSAPPVGRRNTAP
jgi:hypothetical protein